MGNDGLSMEILEFLRKIGAKGGKTGGKRRMAKLTPEERRELARKAGLASGRARRKRKKGNKR
jgi:hypothetical protein